MNQLDPSEYIKTEPWADSIVRDEAPSTVWEPEGLSVTGAEEAAVPVSSFTRSTWPALNKVASINMLEGTVVAPNI